MMRRHWIRALTREVTVAVLECRTLLTMFAAVALAACATVPGDRANQLPAGWVPEGFEARTYDARSWVPPAMLTYDPIRAAERAQVNPVPARGRLLGPEHPDAVRSLATKLWLVDHAKYSIDMVYYIFRRDAAGLSITASLCDAVKRGVDIRVMIDSLGSFAFTHPELHALTTCANEAGWLRTPDGQTTGRRARMQIVVINALTSAHGRINRRSHDKLFIVDGHAPADAVVITGGRNMSVDYYGILDDGSRDPSAYQDLEIVLRNGGDAPDPTVSELATYYYSLLFQFDANRLVSPRKARRGDSRLLGEAAAARERLMAVPTFRDAYDSVDDWMAEDFSDTRVRLAHELGNLRNANAVTHARRNMAQSANSIRGVLFSEYDKPVRSLRIASPYLFLAEYHGQDAAEQFDGARGLLALLEANPDATIEVVTNSVLSTDNPFAQAVIDMETAPRLLMDEATARRWRGARSAETDPLLTESEVWHALASNPRIAIYQIGGLDAVEFGGDTVYGKLHAKFVIVDGGGFIGTDNFDYRSRLFNNEFGFFFESDALAADLEVQFETLKNRSLRWGSDEWLEFRSRMMALRGLKGEATRLQRLNYKVSRATGLERLY